MAKKLTKGHFAQILKNGSVFNEHVLIHISPPSSLEAYMQEIGRAGRRGSPSTALLYFSKSDISQNRADTVVIDVDPGLKTNSS